MSKKKRSVTDAQRQKLQDEFIAKQPPGSVVTKTIEFNYSEITQRLSRLQRELRKPVKVFMVGGSGCSCCKRKKL